MYFVSLTRLRLRSFLFMPGFLFYASRSLEQCKHADGLLDGSLLPDRKLTYWTMTLWCNAAAARGYMATGAHLTAMPKLMRWCDEASVVHWTTNDTALPSWEAAVQKMRTEGRASKVLYPSSAHSSLSFDAARVDRPVPVRPY